MLDKILDKRPDKKLIKKNFKKSINNYCDFNIVQKQMAKKLLSMIKTNNSNNILEIGSYDGTLTKIINENFNFKRYTALDIVEESGSFLKKINPEIIFINYDIETFVTCDKFDLIIANASLQWVCDFKNVILKLKSYLNIGGILAISIFKDDNLFEIKEAFNSGLKYPSDNDIKELFSNSDIFDEKIILQFNNPIEILKHLKSTGVNSTRPGVLSYQEIKKGLDILDRKFKNKLTYHPLYIIDTIDSTD